MKARRTRKKVTEKEPAVDLTPPVAEPEPEPPAPEAIQEGHYGFQTIARYVSADGREIRKMEALEKDRDPLVLVKTSTRFLDESGNVVACSEALATIKGTISSLRGARW